MNRIGAIGAVLAMLAGTSTGAPVVTQPEPAQIKAKYMSVTAQLEQHIETGGFLDDDPASPGLLAKQWDLAAQWAAAAIDGRGAASVDAVKAAMLTLDPKAKPEVMALDARSFLIAAPGAFGNFFILAQRHGRYRLAWSTAEQQSSHGKTAKILAAWQAQNARASAFGTPTGGPIQAQMGHLPTDVYGRARFYLEGTYAVPMGNLVPAQVSIWAWDGSHAIPLFVDRYRVDIGQDTAITLAGDQLMIRHQQDFQVILPPCDCEVRPFEHIVRVGRTGIEDLGEHSLTPELDAVDTFYDRLLHRRSIGDAASAVAIEAGRRIVRNVRQNLPADTTPNATNLGMLQGWHMDAQRGVLCLDTEATGPYLYRLGKSAAGALSIRGIAQAGEPCQTQTKAIPGQPQRPR